MVNIISIQQTTMIKATIETPPVERSKYTLPDVSDTIKRKRLFTLLDRHRKKSVFLVMGQAAQGKSTLIASYLRHSGEKTVWIHLGNEDSDHSNLFYLLINALYNTLGDEKILLGMRYPQTTFGAMQDIQRHRVVFKTLFDSINEKVSIVLDDMDSLNKDASSFRLIQNIMEDITPDIRLFLLSRVFPPLSIQKLKIGKKILLLHNEDLAFTFEETQSFFLKQHKHLKIGQTELKKIHAIADGWAGGLTLLAESINKQSDMTLLPDKLKGESLDFFAEEIFSVQPDYIKDFLVTASFFDIINPDIIAEFSTVENPLKILKELEKRNMFIQRLEQKDKTPLFRFNKLFKNFLENIFIFQTGEKQYVALCTKAGKIFERKKNDDIALKYYIKAENWDRAGELIKKAGTDMVITGRFSDLSQWICSLPAKMIWKDPWLIYYLTMTRRISGGRRNIDDFLTALSQFAEKNDIRGSMLCLSHLIEAAVFLQKPPDMIINWINQGEQLLKSVKDQVFFSYAKAVLWLQIGFGYIAGVGDIPKGLSACRNSRLLADRIGNSDLKFNAIIVSIFGYVQTGEFEQAEHELNKITRPAEEEINPEYKALKNLVNIELLLKKGEFDDAGYLLKQSEADIEKFGLIFLYPGFVEAKAMHSIYTGRYAKAEQLANHLSDISILAGNTVYLGLAYYLRGISLYHRGDFMKAEIEVEKSIEILEKKTWRYSFLPGKKSLRSCSASPEKN